LNESNIDPLLAFQELEDNTRPLADVDVLCASQAQRQSTLSGNKRVDWLGSEASKSFEKTNI
jgi:hypothetical protein